MAGLNKFHHWVIFSLTKIRIVELCANFHWSYPCNVFELSHPVLWGSFKEFCSFVRIQSSKYFPLGEGILNNMLNSLVCRERERDLSNVHISSIPLHFSCVLCVGRSSVTSKPQQILPPKVLTINAWMLEPFRTWLGSWLEASETDVAGCMHVALLLMWNCGRGPLLLAATVHYHVIRKGYAVISCYFP